MAVRGMGLAVSAAAVAALVALAAPPGAASGQPATAWRLTRLAPADAGTQGARWPSVAEGAAIVAFRHDGEIDSGGAPRNPALRPQVFAWRPGGALAQLTDTTAQPAGAIEIDRPIAAADGLRIAFLARGDLTGGNAEHAREAFLWDAGALRQLSDGAAGTAAEKLALAAHGRAAAFWHTADLAGANPGRVPQIFLAREGEPVAQLTAFGARPFVGEVAIAANGDAPNVAFITDADPAGDNADGSWELFLWRGPVSRPGDPARFVQLTDWRPPMTGREIYHPSIDAAGDAVAFAGKGHVDAGQPAAHVPAEVYLWRAATGLARLTTASSPRASSWLPRVSDDGRHVALVSVADLAPAAAGAPGNADGSAEAFVWSEGGALDQVTASTARPGVLSAEPEVGLGVEARGRAVAFVAERADDPAPLALLSRRGVPFLAERDAAPPTVPPATSAIPPTAPPATPTAAAPPPDGVCPQVRGRIPAAVVADALANPERYHGWRRPRHLGLPPGPGNPPRTWLTLRDLGKPYGPFNAAVWRAGCP